MNQVNDMNEMVSEGCCGYPVYPGIEDCCRADIKIQKKESISCGCGPVEESTSPKKSTSCC